MLKKISRLFLGLVVCAGSACVTPTHVSSADGIEGIIITRIQASGASGAKDEYVVLHNNSGVEVDITNWCLMNKSDYLFACFVSTRSDMIERFYIPPYGDAVIVSKEYAQASGLPDSAYGLVYEVTSQSSGSLVNSGDIVQLLDENGMYVDSKYWETSIPTGKALARTQIMSGPDIYANTNSGSDWGIQMRALTITNNVRKVLLDIPDPLPEPDPQEEPSSEPTILQYPIITEILANPSGSDVDNEFIEVFNPNEHDSISLNQYTLLIGTDSVKSYAFVADTIIPPLTYAVISNKDLGYTLVNTTGRVQLAKDGVNIGEAIEYVSPKDDYVWALIEGAWQYAKPATPGTFNSLPATSGDETDDSSETNSSKPCAANQFRNPETGRCKLSGAVSSAPAPCKENQTRNPETNRCRNIVSTSSPAPCKEGQERNAETNRCRAIVKMSKVGNAVSAQTKADAAMSGYYWAAIGTVILLVVGYAVWEWRQELVSLWTRVRTIFAKHSD